MPFGFINFSAAGVSGAWKWNFLAPVTPMAMSNTKNWPAVSVPTDGGFR